MRISLLREFITLARNLNFHKTAQELFITQSVLSKHIASLETQIGAPLFERNRHHVTLTAIGKLFYEDAAAIVDRYDDSLARIHAASRTEQTLRIGYLQAHFKKLLVSVVKRFEQTAPDIRLVLLAGEYVDLQQKLKNNELDVILTITGDQDLLSWCETRILYTDPICAAIPVNHPLARRQRIEIRDLAGERIFLPSLEYFRGFAQFLEDRFADEGFSGAEVLRYDCVNSSLLLVEAGDGISIMPQKLQSNASPGVNFAVLSGDALQIDVVAAWKKNNHPETIRQFIKTLNRLPADPEARK